MFPLIFVYVYVCGYITVYVCGSFSTLPPTEGGSVNYNKKKLGLSIIIFWWLEYEETMGHVNGDGLNLSKVREELVPIRT